MRRLIDHVIDTDDPAYRLWTMVQLVGVLILAAGVPKIAQGDWASVTAAVELALAAGAPLAGAIAKCPAGGQTMRRDRLTS